MALTSCLADSIATKIGGFSSGAADALPTGFFDYLSPADNNDSIFTVGSLCGAGSTVNEDLAARSMSLSFAKDLSLALADSL